MENKRFIIGVITLLRNDWKLELRKMLFLAFINICFTQFPWKSFPDYSLHLWWMPCIATNFRMLDKWSITYYAKKSTKWEPIIVQLSMTYTQNERKSLAMTVLWIEGELLVYRWMHEVCTLLQRMLLVTSHDPYVLLL